jgi:deoxyadenosine/deoxycytidine kinase
MRRLNFVLLNGAMGSGKSTVARLLADKLERTAILEIEDVRRLVTGKEDNALAWKVIYRMCDAFLENRVSVLLKQTAASEDLVNKFCALQETMAAGLVFITSRRQTAYYEKELAGEERPGMPQKR